LAVLAGTVLCAQPAAKQLERLASRLPYFCAQNYFFDQPGCWGDRELEYRQLTAQLAAIRVPVALLRHPASKVRTLAIASLFAQEDPQFLPPIAALAGDTAATFPTVLPDARPLFPGVERKPFFQDQTVGQVAEQALRVYLEPAGFFGGSSQFEAYWSARKNRPYCAGWFQVQLDRASGRTSPTPPDRISRIRAVRRRVDRVPEPDRTWILLRLNGEEGSDALVSEQELRRACRRLGPEPLLGMLQRRIPTGDPDLQPRDNNNYPYARMTHWVLQRAGELLRPNDAALLLDQEQRERRSGLSDPNITAWWVIGAAQLRPDWAARILREALPRFSDDWRGDDRANLATAMWQLASPRQTRFLVDWFYAERPERGRYPHSRALFLRLLGERSGPSPRDLLASIVSDDRLDSLDWQSLDALVKAVNLVAEKPVVTAAELEKASHPLGQGHFHWERDRAADKYPRETRQLLEVLAGWRNKLRRTLPQWSVLR
jgi:hypothetical protein